MKERFLFQRIQRNDCIGLAWIMIRCPSRWWLVVRIGRCRRIFLGRVGPSRLFSSCCSTRECFLCGCCFWKRRVWRRFYLRRGLWRSCWSRWCWCFCFLCDCSRLFLLCLCICKWSRTFVGVGWWYPWGHLSSWTPFLFRPFWLGFYVVVVGLRLTNAPWDCYKRIKIINLQRFLFNYLSYIDLLSSDFCI